MPKNGKRVHYRTNVQGTHVSPTTPAADSIASLLAEMKRNFLSEKIEIMEGLEFNQYETLKTIHFYLNSKFENGDVDENGNDKFFHNIINHRNAHATKNIDLDTKDMRVTTDLENSYWKSWILRMELQNWMRDERFASVLNQMAEDLPRFGSVIWKKTMDAEGKVCIQNVDLRDVICDQAADTLLGSQVFAERIIMSAQQIRDKVADGWDEDAVEKLLAAGSFKKQPYLQEVTTASAGVYALTDSLPAYEVYEVWGWIPETFLPDKLKPGASEDAEDGEAPELSSTKYKYVMAIVSGLEPGGANQVLFAEAASPEDFPYKEVHMRKNPGRWLGLGNTEMLIPLQIRINELVNRFFMALRMGSLHLFQTRGKMYLKNLMQDAVDGDILETTHPIEPVATEIRAFNQYQNEVQMIEVLADKICNTFEVVTGESMPAATPFRLGAQLGASAKKLFEFVRQNCGIFVSDVMFDWVLPEIGKKLDREHMIDLMGSVEELTAFDEAYRNSVLYGQLKDYILSTGYLPTREEFDTAAKTLSEQMKSSDRKIKIEKGFMDEEFLEKARISVDPTGETEDQSATKETLGNILQIVTSNPAILQDPNARMIIGRIMEYSGISPLKLVGFTSAPVQPMPGMDAASPAMSKFASNPGDASAKLAPQPSNSAPTR